MKQEGISRLWSETCVRYFNLVFSMWIVLIPFLLLSCILKVHTFAGVYCVEEKNTWLYGLEYFVIDMFGLSNMLGTPIYNTTWWYLSLAVILIFIMPLINMTYDKINCLSVQQNILVLITSKVILGAVM